MFLWEKWEQCRKVAKVRAKSVPTTVGTRWVQVGTK